MTVPRTVLITLSTRHREVDVVADADIPLSELIGPVAGLLGIRATDVAVTVAPDGELDTTWSAQLTETLTDARVADGARVILHPLSQPPRPVVQVAWSGAGASGRPADGGAR